MKMTTYHSNNKPREFITDEVSNKILDYFLNNKENGSRVIAKELSLKESTVNRVLTGYFQKLRKKVEK